MISIIAALGKNNVIGSDNRLPWKLSADMKHFVSITRGKTVVMGRKTFESIGKPLPNRTNIIVTRDRNYKQEGCVVVHSIEGAIDVAGHAEELIVIGGASIYREFLPFADRMYLTLINSDFEGDVFFPRYSKEWRETEREEHPADDVNKYDYAFVTLERIN